DRKTLGQPVNALPVQRIDLDPPGTDQAGQAAIRANLDRMAQGVTLVLRTVLAGGVMIEIAFDLLNLAGKRAPERDVQLLHAAADREQRNSLVERLADQGQRGGVP